MTLQRLPDGSVKLGQMDEWHLRTVQGIPELADAGDDEKALRRLYPAPFVAGDADEEQKEDWAELVQPDIEQLFEDSLTRVRSDAKKVHPDDTAPPPAEDPVAEEGEAPRPARPRRGKHGGKSSAAPAVPRDLWYIIVPANHVEDWYRAMNQARLVLSEKYDAHRSDSAHVAKMFVSGRMELLLQYELLTGLCGWWVEFVMHS
jgi:hypothetical protein